MADFISHKLLDFHSINPAGASLPFHVSPYLSLYTVCLSPPKRRSFPPISCNHSSHSNSNSTPPLVIVSTTEYSDGGFLFRFGDPSEIVEGVNDDSDSDIDAVEGSDDVLLEPNPVAVGTVHEAELPVLLSDANELEGSDDVLLEPNPVAVEIVHEAELPVLLSDADDDVLLEPSPVAVETVHEAELPVLLSDANELEGSDDVLLEPHPVAVEIVHEAELPVLLSDADDDVLLEPSPVAVETVHKAELPVLLSDANEQDFETVFVGAEENETSTSVLENVTDFQEESDTEEVDTSPEFDVVATSSPLEEEAPVVINDDDDDDDDNDSVYPEVSLEIVLPNLGCGTDELTEIAENSLNADSLDSLVHVGDSVTADLALEEEIGEDFPGDDLLSAEREEICSPTLALASGVVSLTCTSKVLTGVEDAYFVSDEKWFIVANSVGEWSFEGMKPGLYGRELVKNFQSLTSNSDGCKANVREVLRQSAATKQSSGVASALIAHFNNEVLHVANIGDTGFIILRNGFVHESSSPVMHEFYLPVQIGSSDDPLQVVEEHQIHLDDGDAIIIATDGLFDNLYDEDIASMVSKSLQDNMDPKELAEHLATRAQEVGSSLSARCPFADKAKAAGYTEFTGGKLDHVTVIVSLVKKQLSPR